MFFPSLRLKYLGNNLGFSRFAVVASVKVSKKATVRNRLKRQIREIIRLNKEKIKPSHDLVIAANARALDKDYQQLQTELFSLFFKAKLLQ